MTDWIGNTLSAVGPVADIDFFRAAAAGSGVVPWTLDLDSMEEDWFLPMAGSPAISLSGARILARRLRDAVAANHARAIARTATDRRTPFDLHRLLPVPAPLLRLGPEDPSSVAWLRAHWGTTRALRHVAPLPGEIDGRRRRVAEWRVAFWSAEWSPWQALAGLRRAWPALRLELTPDYDERDD